MQLDLFDKKKVPQPHKRDAQNDHITKNKRKTQPRHSGQILMIQIITANHVSSITDVVVTIADILKQYTKWN